MKNIKKNTNLNKDTNPKNGNDPLFDDVKLVPGNNADLTEEDLEALGPEDLSMDLGDDEDLKHRLHPIDFSAKDLDIPGSELDDDDEVVGSEDEENNSYSIDQDDNEEDNSNIQYLKQLSGEKNNLLIHNKKTVKYFTVFLL